MVLANLLVTTLAVTATVVPRAPVLTRPIARPYVQQNFQPPNLLATTLGGGAPPAAPFIPVDFPQQKIAAPRAQQIDYLNLLATTLAPVVVQAPFIPPLFDQARSRPRVDSWLPPNLLTSTLYTPVEFDPFVVSMGGAARAAARSQDTNTANLLATTLSAGAPVAAPFVPVVFDQVRRRPTVQSWLPPNLLTSTLYVPVLTDPFVIWIIGGVSRARLRTQDTSTVNLLQTTLGLPVVQAPFVPVTFPQARSPAQARRIDHVNLLTATLAVDPGQPFTPYDWPQVRPVPRSYETWTHHQPITLGIPLPPPAGGDAPPVPPGRRVIADLERTSSADGKGRLVTAAERRRTLT